MKNVRELFNVILIFEPLEPKQSSNNHKPRQTTSNPLNIEPLEPWQAVLDVLLERRQEASRTRRKA